MSAIEIAVPLFERRRWRLFFLATAGLFGHANGSEWGVDHYRLKPHRVSSLQAKPSQEPMVLVA